MEFLQQQLIRPTSMQEHNAYIVLEFIKQHGPVSRAETARSLGFSKSAISNLIAVLFEDELLEVVGTGHPATGRKSQLLSFNPDAFFTVGVEIVWGEVRSAVINLNGRVVSNHAVPVSDITNVSGAIEQAAEAVERVITDSGQTRSRIAGVGVMIPGIVDAAAGRVVYSSVLQWNEPVDLASEIEARLHIPVFLENDANALALAEMWVGWGGQFSNIALLFLSHGVGGAFFSKSHVLRGRNYAGMEIGKMIICGRDGPASVESVLSFDNLRSMFGLDGSLEVESLEMLLERIRQRAHEDLETVRLSFADVTDSLAQVIANVIAMLNPDAVFLDTALTDAYPQFVPEIEEGVAGYLPRRPELSVRLYPTSLNAEEEILGGAAVAMYRTRFRFIITGKDSSEEEAAPYSVNM